MERVVFIYLEALRNEPKFSIPVYYGMEFELTYLNLLDRGFRST